MTLKLQTMLLPTGEFVLIGSTPNLPSPQALEGFAGFRRDAGAVAMLLIDQDVEVENAMIDADAVRADFWSDFDDDEPDGGPDGDDGERQPADGNLIFFPNLKGDSQTVNFSVDPEGVATLSGTFAAHPPEDTDWRVVGSTDIGDQILAQRLAEGAEFSPAGLVINAASIDTQAAPDYRRAARAQREPQNYDLLLENGPEETSFAVEQVTPDLLTLMEATRGTVGQSRVDAALQNLANPDHSSSRSCPCWPLGDRVPNVVRCVSCPLLAGAQ